jgi:hypothetical protein
MARGYAIDPNPELRTHRFAKVRNERSGLILSVVADRVLEIDDNGPG